MSIFSFFKRKPQPASVSVTPSSEKRHDSRSNLTIKGADDIIKECSQGLSFVRDRERLNSKAEALAFVMRKYRAHAERQLREEGIVTIKPAKKPQAVVAEQSSALPPKPPLGLASKEVVERRIDLCKRALSQIAERGYSWALHKEWTETLEAQERLMVLLDSGLRLESRVTHGVLVDGKHYYRLGPAKAKMLGNTQFVPMDVHTFVASVGQAA